MFLFSNCPRSKHRAAKNKPQLTTLSHLRQQVAALCQNHLVVQTKLKLQSHYRLPEVVYFMNPQENQDNQRRLQELEKEINQKKIREIGTRLGQQLQQSLNSSQLLSSVSNQVSNWFNSLPSPAKVAVAIIAALMGISLLSSIVKLFAALVSLTILGVILYLGYKYLILPQSRK